MTLRIRMILINQFNHLLEELEIASEELDKINNKEIKSINTDIIIARQRVEDFKIKAIKEFEKRHSEKLKRLRAKKRENRALAKKKT